jgi:hypothetical protein
MLLVFKILVGFSKFSQLGLGAFARRHGSCGTQQQQRKPNRGHAMHSPETARAQFKKNYVRVWITLASAEIIDKAPTALDEENEERARRATTQF